MTSTIAVFPGRGAAVAYSNLLFLEVFVWADVISVSVCVPVITIYCMMYSILNIVIWHKQTQASSNKSMQSKLRCAIR